MKSLNFILITFILGVTYFAYSQAQFQNKAQSAFIDAMKRDDAESMARIANTMQKNADFVSAFIPEAKD